MVKLIDVERLATIIDEGSNAIFLCFSFIVVMMMVMVVVMLLLIVFIVVMMVVMFFVFVIVIVMMMVMMMFFFVFIILMVVMSVQSLFFLFLSCFTFQFSNPCGRSGNTFEIKHIGVEQHIQFHIAIVAIDDGGFGLQGMENFANASELLW